MQRKLSKDSTYMKITTSSKLMAGASVNSQVINKRSDKYQFDRNGSVILPYQQYLMYRNGSEMAEIDLRPLFAYPQYEHHIHTKTYNQQSPFSDPTQSQIIVNFMQPNFNVSQGMPLKLTFHDANLTHDTEMISKMSPYIKLYADDIAKWTSKVCQKGDKHPNFKKQSANLVLNNINEYVRIEVWDKDMRQDDFIGGAHVRGYDFLGKGPEVQEYPLVYLKKNQTLPAGSIRIQAESPGFM